MKVISRSWHNVSREDRWTLYPLGDIHLGNVACHEKEFRALVQRIAADDRALWVGMGDYCDFINRSDPRFSTDSLAPWVRMLHLGDLARAQMERFVEIVTPIAGKCLGLIEGNHERVIHKHYERNIYSDIVTGVKEAGGFDADTPLAFGYSGWLILKFYRSSKQEGAAIIRVNLHHGFVGGKLAGAKALNMQRWLWTHDADLVLFGHSHNQGAQPEAVEQVRGSKVTQQVRKGCFCGTFLSGAPYAEEKGYFPLPVVWPWIVLHPGAHEQRNRIRIVS